MLKKNLRKLMLSVAALTLTFFGLSSIASAQYVAGAPTERAIQPVMYTGNFVAADDDQVCYEISKIVVFDVLTEMRGFKIDPGADFDNGKVAVDVSDDGKFLDWDAATGTTVLYFIVKGGPNFNLYNYANSGFDWDNGLHSPGTTGKRGITYPQISHYNVCYTTVPGDSQGCTPGYWRNHADRWPTGTLPSADFDATFSNVNATVDFFNPNVTLGWAIWASGGGLNAFARHATAAYLSARAKEIGSNGQFVNYPYSSDTVIAMVQAAYADPSLVESTKDAFAAANELGCPLGGTPAFPVVP